MGAIRRFLLLEEPEQVTESPYTPVVYGGSPVPFHATTLEGMKVQGDFQNSGVVVEQFRSSAVYRGVTLLADLTAQLPWYAVTGGDPSMTRQQKVEPEQRLDVQPRLLLEPQMNEDRDDVLRRIVISMLVHGNAYLYGMMPVDGYPQNIMVVNPNEVAVTPNARNTAAVYKWRGEQRLKGVNWYHLMLNPVPGRWTGVGPFTAGADIIAGIRNADNYARRLFTESGMPAGVLKHPGKLTKDEADKLRQAWDQSHQGGRGTAILSGGIEFEGISLTPEQAQFLATRAYGSQEVARLLGIPQWFLNAGSPPGTASALTYQNLNQVFVELTRTMLYPSILRRIEKVFSSMLPRGQAVKFDLSKFLENDLGDRALAAKQLTDAGYDGTDVATMLNLPLRWEAPQPVPSPLAQEPQSVNNP